MLSNTQYQALALRPLSLISVNKPEPLPCGLGDTNKRGNKKMATQAAGSKKKEINETDEVNGASALINEAGVTLENAKEAGKSLLSDAKATLSEKASATVDDQKAMLTGGLTSVAAGIRNMTGSLNEVAEPNVLTEYSAKYAGAAADKVESVAQYLDTADLKTMARDVESFARRNPAIFIGAAFGLGMLAARFIKSSGSDGSNSRSGSRGRKGSSAADASRSRGSSATARVSA